jgi:hypothetical protein
MTVTQAIFDAVWSRDQGCCVRCGAALVGARGLSWSVHHRRPRGAGGSKVPWVDKPANLILLCGSGTTGCHGWCESHRVFARASGWLVPLNGTAVPSSVPVHHSIHGVVILDDLGGTTSQEVPW